MAQLSLVNVPLLASHQDVSCGVSHNSVFCPVGPETVPAPCGLLRVHLLYTRAERRHPQACQGGCTSTETSTSTSFASTSIHVFTASRSSTCTFMLALSQVNSHLGTWYSLYSISSHTHTRTHPEGEGVGKHVEVIFMCISFVGCGGNDSQRGVHPPHPRAPTPSRYCRGPQRE